MSVNHGFDERVAVQHRSEEVATAQTAPPIATELFVPLVSAVVPERPAVAAETHPSQPVASTSRRRPPWVVPAAIAAVGLIASGALGYFLYATIGQRDAASHQLAATQASLTTTKSQLTSAESDAATKKVTADYVSLYVANHGAVQTDYQNFVACDGYSACRTVAQQLMADLQAFQLARSSANVPPALSSSDAMLGDALSAAIAATQLMISGMDKSDMAKFKDGYTKVDAAMLSVAKAEAALASALR
ncbi:MAG: hypothetical protein PVS3B2_17410 [Candidatus Dormibacteraceae bacterium]